VVATLFDHVWLDYGKYIEDLDAKKLGLPSGAYVVVLTVDGAVLKQKMLKL
jgi:hypothetical protein